MWLQSISRRRRYGTLSGAPRAERWGYRSPSTAARSTSTHGWSSSGCSSAQIAPGSGCSRFPVPWWRCDKVLDLPYLELVDREPEFIRVVLFRDRRRRGSGVLPAIVVVAVGLRSHASPTTDAMVDSYSLSTCRDEPYWRRITDWDIAAGVAISSPIGTPPPCSQFDFRLFDQ